MNALTSQLGRCLVLMGALMFTTLTLAHDEPLGSNPHILHDAPSAPELLNKLDSLRELELPCNAKAWIGMLGGLLDGTSGAKTAHDHEIRGSATGAVVGALVGGSIGCSVGAEDPRCQPPALQRRSPREVTI